MSSTKPIRIGSIRRFSEIVDLLQREGPLGPSEIGKSLDIPPSTAHDYLSSLRETEYVIEDDGKYDLGLKFLDHGMAAREGRAISEVGQPTIERLAEETREAAWIVVSEHGKAVYLNNAAGEQAVVTARIGTRSHLHYLASGRSILAHLPEEEVRAIVDRHGLPQRTAQTITELEPLLDKLELVRDRGYAVSVNEAIDGVWAVGAPILVDERVRGAVSVSGPIHRLSGDGVSEEIVDQVLVAANELELKLGRQL